MFITLSEDNEIYLYGIVSDQYISSTFSNIPTCVHMHTYTGHADRIQSVSWNNDLGLLIVNCKNNSSYIWSIISGKKK